MVFVTVGRNTSDNSIGVLTQVREVGKHEIDTEHVEIREHQPAVEKEDFSLHFDAGAVTTDFAEPTEKRDRNGRSLRVANQWRLC